MRFFYGALDLKLKQVIKGSGFKYATSGSGSYGLGFSRVSSMVHSIKSDSIEISNTYVLNVQMQAGPRQDQSLNV